MLPDVTGGLDKPSPGTCMSILGPGFLGLVLLGMASCFHSFDPQSVTCEMGAAAACPNGYVCTQISDGVSKCRHAGSQDGSLSRADGSQEPVDALAQLADGKRDLSTGSDDPRADNNSSIQQRDAEGDNPQSSLDDSGVRDLPPADGVGGTADVAPTGGALGAGGAVGSTGGTTGSGGAGTGSGGNGRGGTTGGQTGSGGNTATGGNTGTGGSSGRGGATTAGGTTSLGGTTGTGGATSSGGTTSAGGVTGTGGTQAAPSSGCGRAPSIPSSQYNTGTTIPITVNGIDRRYILNVPTTYDNTRPYDLVLALHALDSNDRSVYSQSYYGLLPRSNDGAIFVAPNGSKSGTPCSGTGIGESGCGWANTGGADMAFLDALVAQIAQSFCVDMNRIFATGWSYGGSMSYEVGCQRPLGGGSATWGVRAVAIYSGAQLSGSCKPSSNNPVAYYTSHGTQDTVLSYAGGVTLAQNWATANGCTWQTPTKVTSGDHVCTTMTGCKAGYPVEFCSFYGTHTPFPDAGTLSSSWGPAEVWTFLSQF